MRLIPIKEEPDFMREEKSGSIVQTNEEAYQAYLKSKEKAANLENRVEELSSSVQEIKAMLEFLIKNKT